MSSEATPIKSSEELLERADCYRIDANCKLEPKRKSEMGQFMTPSAIASFMASLFQKPPKSRIRLLDAGAGIGTLTAAFVERFSNLSEPPNIIESIAYEIDAELAEYLKNIEEECRINRRP